MPYPTDQERLVGSIRDELQAQRALRDLALDDQTLDSLSDAIATNIDYGFDVRWAGRWVRRGDPHRWIENGGTQAESHFGECLSCRVITEHPSVESANEWWSRHQSVAHQ